MRAQHSLLEATVQKRRVVQTLTRQLVAKLQRSKQPPAEGQAATQAVAQQLRQRTATVSK